MPRHIDDFADEKQTGKALALHRLRGKLIRIDAAGGDFGLFIAFGASRGDRPLMKFGFQFLNGMVRP